MKCIKCQEDLDESLFSDSRVCDLCQDEPHKPKYKNAAIWGYQLQSKYGITEGDYNEMYVAQDGCCDICGIHQSRLTRRLAVDHDHETGKVRSLLCTHCNTLLGLAREDTDVLEEAIEYIRRHQRD